MNEEYIIKQLSIFTENKSGKLAAVSKIFLDSGVSIQAFSIAEVNNFGVIRAIVDHPKVAFDAFSRMNYAVKYTDVLAIRMKDVPGGLFEVTKILSDLSINIEYAYAFCKNDDASLIIKVSNLDEAVNLIKKSNLELLKAKEYSL